MKDRGLTIEACPTSNLKTSPTLSLQAHPIGEMVSEGLKVTVCTDDMLLFDKTLSEEFKLVHDQFGFD